MTFRNLINEDIAKVIPGRNYKDKQGNIVNLIDIVKKVGGKDKVELEDKQGKTYEIGLGIFKSQYTLLESDITENVSIINDFGIGNIIVDTICLIANAHIWHLVSKSGQKHTALNELYTTLQDEVDELAERYVAQGGLLPAQSNDIGVDLTNEDILLYVDEFRAKLTTCISKIKDIAILASISDGIIDLQECVDSFTYKFKLD